MISGGTCSIKNKENNQYESKHFITFQNLNGRKGARSFKVSQLNVSVFYKLVVLFHINPQFSQLITN
jgi:hypothetical protein